MDYFLIGLIVMLAALLKGITGFGFALVALPFLMLWYSPMELIPVLVACNLFASIIIVLQRKERKLVDSRFQILIFVGGLFTVTGVLILSFISERILTHIMSVFFIVLSVLSLLGVKYNIKSRKWVFVAAGAVIGALTGSISISGPPLALFLHSAKVDKRQFREIFAWFSIVTSVVAMAGYAFVGLLSPQTLRLTCAFLPILFIGTYWGKRLNHRFSAGLFKRISILITLIAGVLLLLR